LKQNGSVQGEKAREYADISALSTQRRAIFVKFLLDVQMASLSNQIGLGKTSNLPRRQFGPIGSPFGRLNSVSNGS